MNSNFTTNERQAAINQINPNAPLGVQDYNNMNAAAAPRDRFFLSIVCTHKDGYLSDREKVKMLIGSMFRCSRIVVADEET
jgi:hypothetical protein